MHENIALCEPEFHVRVKFIEECGYLLRFGIEQGVHDVVDGVIVADMVEADGSSDH